MALKKGDSANFNTMLKAATNGALCLMECTDKATGRYVAVICAVNRPDGDDYEMVPIARLFGGNPYDELDPPHA